jgi:hypothetical protein
MPLAAEQVEFAAGCLRWERVCDFWQLKRHYMAVDTSCDHLFRSAGRAAAVAERPLRPCHPRPNQQVMAEYPVA